MSGIVMAVEAAVNGLFHIRQSLPQSLVLVACYSTWGEDGTESKTMHFGFVLYVFCVLS